MTVDKLPDLNPPTFGDIRDPDGPAARLAQVMLDELATLELAPLLLPISKDLRLARVMNRLIENPALPDSLEQLANKVGASVTKVALDLGYSTTSSFVYMFRSNLGVSPGNYGVRGGMAVHP